MERSHSVGRARPRGLVRRLIALGALVGSQLAFVSIAAEPAGAHSAPPGYQDGANSECDAWKIVFLDLGFTSVDFEIAEEGWVWVDPSRKLQDASGVVTGSHVAYNDTPSNHFSHDWNVDIRVDEGQEYLLSDVNHREEGSPVPTKIEMEWETGIVPSEKSGDGLGWFPRWVRPNAGDRAWTNGHWVFDCGHASTVSTPFPIPDDPSSCPEGTEPNPFTDLCSDSHYRTEIHPGRAIATMRSQSAPIPGSGTTPVPVTATDLFIHGRGGFMVQQLECGIDTILQEITHSCPYKTTAIDDLYRFDICLPPKPDEPSAMLDWSIEDGPGNTRSEDVTIEEVEVEATDGCATPLDEFGNDFDDHTKLRVTIDLRESGAVPDDVLARRIVAGWVFPPDEPLHHLNVTLEQMDLHDDHEFDPGDGDMTFFWMNLNRSPLDEWYRLSDFDVPDPGDACDASYHGMEDYDDDFLSGDGLMDFCGPVFDFYLADDDTFDVRTTGYEQDCYEGFFGTGGFNIEDYVFCHTVGATGNNDRMPSIEATYGLADVGTRPEPTAGEYCTPTEPPVCFGGEYEIEFTIEEVSLDLEDTADLEVDKTCSHDGEVPLVGEPFTCTITIDNLGPGLPRDVTLTDTLTTELDPSEYTLGTPTATVGPLDLPVPCSVQPPDTFTCDIGTVPVDERATIEFTITPHAPGVIADDAVVATDSTDPESSNDTGSASVDVFLPITIDVSPGDPLPAVNTSRRGLISVAVITDELFDAADLDVATACFGDADHPGERDCTESHGVGHQRDVDRDRDLDLLLHYDTLQTGIDPGDTTACLIARTVGGIGVYGCDTIRAT